MKDIDAYNIKIGRSRLRFTQSFWFDLIWSLLFDRFQIAMMAKVIDKFGVVGHNNKTKQFSLFFDAQSCTMHDDDDSQPNRWLSYYMNACILF